MTKKPVLLAILMFALLVFSPRPCGAQELVNLASVSPGIVVDLRYATSDNFTKTVLYPSKSAYLLASAAEALSRVEAGLRKQGFGLKIWDAYRPLSVQKKLWKLIPDERYVAPPERGSNHNRGASVDVTLVDSTGKELPMPTLFDDFSEKAAASSTDCSLEAQRNRKILQDAMTREGFQILDSEWWHFDYDKGRDHPVLDQEIPAN